MQQHWRGHSLFSNKYPVIIGSLVKTAETAAEFSEDIWALRREWIRELIATGERFSLLSGHIRLIVSDPQFAEIFRIPRVIRYLARSQNAFFAAMPTQDGWVVTLTPRPDFSGAKYASMLRQEFTRLAIEITRLIIDGSDNDLLIQKQEEATAIYNLLPRGMQQELAHMTPWIVTNSRVGQSP